MRTNALDWVSLFLAIVGAITWGILGVTGLVGPEPLNVLALAFEPVFQPAAAEILLDVVYVLFGLAGLYLIYTAARLARASRRAARAARKTESMGDGDSSTETARTGTETQETERPDRSDT